VDLAGEAFPFLEHAPTCALPLDQTQAQDGGERDQCAQRRSDHRADGQLVAVPAEAEYGGQREQPDAEGGRSVRQQVGGEEEQREGEPDAFRGQQHEDDPGQDQHGQPDQRRGTAAADHRQQSGHVDRGEQSGDQQRRDPRRSCFADGVDHDQRQQEPDQQVEPEPERLPGGGKRRGHGVTRIGERRAPSINRKV
jgi:hypothetical protein